MYLQSRPENEGYIGVAKDQNAIELVEQANIQTEDTKYSKFVFLERNGTTYVATDLVLKQQHH
jgi:hypothetical protein